MRHAYADTQRLKKNYQILILSKFNRNSLLLTYAYSCGYISYLYALQSIS